LCVRGSESTFDEKCINVFMIVLEMVVSFDAESLSRNDRSASGIESSEVHCKTDLFVSVFVGQGGSVVGPVPVDGRRFESHAAT